MEINLMKADLSEVFKFLTEEERKELISLINIAKERRARWT